MKCHEKEVSWLLHNYTPPRTEAAQIFPHFSSCNWLITIFYNIFIYNIITYNQ